MNPFLPIALSALTLCSLTAGCSKPAESAQEPNVPKIDPALDKQPRAGLSQSQMDLLGIAFRAASSLPVDPHIKTRARAQESVVTTSLVLDQPDLAMAYTARIDNWRRGVAYADVAYHHALNHRPDEARRCLDLAVKAFGETRDPDGQEWREERLKARLARTHLVLREHEQAEELVAGVEEAERGTVVSARARLTDAHAFESRMSELAVVAAGGGFDEVRSALEGYVALFETFYSDVSRRSAVAETIRSSSLTMPPQIRIDLILAMANAALSNEDSRNAQLLVEDAQRILGESRWLPENQVAIQGRLAAFRHKAGDAAGAGRLLDSALALFHAERDRIVNIDRASALRPVAEAFHACGDLKKALEVYRLALECGQENPNSRPRAEDLCATCLSMARLGVEPDAELMARIMQICEGLGDPW